MFAGLHGENVLDSETSDVCCTGSSLWLGSGTHREIQQKVPEVSAVSSGDGSRYSCLYFVGYRPDAGCDRTVNS